MKTYAVVNADSGLVENTILWDGSDDWVEPEGCLVIESDTAGIGWRYAQGVFVAPEPAPPIPRTPAEILASNIVARDSLLSQAALAIAPLQDAVDLDTATAEEVAQLTLWKRYRVEVNRIDLTLDGPAWPAQPQ